MGQRRSSRGIAIVTIVWVMAVSAAFAITTLRGDDAIAQGGGCRGGGSSGSPSPSESASPSPSDTGPLSSILPSGVPPAPDAVPAPAPAQMDPYEKVPVVAAEQGISCKSTVTIAYRSSGRKGFKGKVGSDEPMCKRARKVTVKKVKKGNDPTVGRSATNAKGAYFVPAAKARGKFYAMVAKSTTKNDDGKNVSCQAAKSRTIRP